MIRVIDYTLHLFVIQPFVISSLIKKIACITKQENLFQTRKTWFSNTVLCYNNLRTLCNAL